MIELLLANWVAIAIFHFCTHELPMLGAAGYFVYRYFRPKADEEDCCDHECEETKI